MNCCSISAHWPGLPTTAMPAPGRTRISFPNRCKPFRCILGSSNGIVSREVIHGRVGPLLFRVIDIETTGLSPPAEVIEIGRVDVVEHGGAIQIEPPMSRLYRPLRGIPPETMAIHHITEADFDEHTPICTDERLQMAVWRVAKPDLLVAHNYEFERRFIPETITQNLSWICTYKVSLRVWPDAPRHTNQVLRYWKAIALDQTFAMPPHRAGPDAWVTAHLLAELLKVASVSEMVSWTAEPALYPTIPIGRYRGSPWSEVPTEYLEWIDRLERIDDGIRLGAKRELKRRHKS
jgi:exodeoxyribonuclease X